MNLIIYFCIAVSLYGIFSAYDSERKKLHTGPLVMAMLLLALTSALGIGVHPEVFGQSLIPLAVLLLFGGFFLAWFGLHLLRNSSPFSENPFQFLVFGFVKADDFAQILFAGLCVMAIGGCILYTEISCWSYTDIQAFATGRNSSTVATAPSHTKTKAHSLPHQAKGPSKSNKPHATGQGK